MYASLKRERSTGARGTRVIEQRPQFRDRYRQIRPEDLLAEEVVEHPADRRLQERRAAGMTGRVPRVLVLVRELREGPEKGRKQPSLVAAHGEGHPAGDELRGILQQPHVLLDLPLHLQRKVPGHRAAGEQEDREVIGQAAHLADDVERMPPAGVGGPDIPVQQDAADRRVRPHLGGTIARCRGVYEAVPVGAEDIGDTADHCCRRRVGVVGDDEGHPAESPLHRFTSPRINGRRPDRLTVTADVEVKPPPVRKKEFNYPERTWCFGPA
jgi:hypothetical protein